MKRFETIIIGTGQAGPSLATMVYLKGVRSKDAAMKVNSDELAALVA